MKPALEILLLSIVAAFAWPRPAAPQLESDPRVVPDERSLAYRHDPELGWFPKASHSIRFAGGNRAIHIAHNAMGFRDRNHPEEKTRPRLAFLGDSFVWGYDVEAEERFTDLLQAAVDTIEVWNLGVSGYGTDQCYLLIQKLFDRCQPDAVIYMFSATDIDDNAVNYNYGAYYKPYFVVAEGALELRGVPVPRGSVWSRLLRSIVDRFPRFANREDVTPLLVSALDDFVRSKGASFAVGLIDDHPPLRDYLQRQKIVFFDLSHVGEGYRYSDHGSHWTPEGHRMVARAIQAFLLHNAAQSP